MLYSEAIATLEKLGNARFAPSEPPEKEKVEEAVRTVADMATVQACPKYALHAAICWLVENWEAKEA